MFTDDEMEQIEQEMMDGSSDAECTNPDCDYGCTIEPDGDYTCPQCGKGRLQSACIRLGVI